MISLGELIWLPLDAIVHSYKFIHILHSKEIIYLKDEFYMDLNAVWTFYIWIYYWFCCFTKTYFYTCKKHRLCHPEKIWLQTDAEMCLGLQSAYEVLKWWRWAVLGEYSSSCGLFLCVSFLCLTSNYTERQLSWFSFFCLQYMFL